MLNDQIKSIDEYIAEYSSKGYEPRGGLLSFSLSDGRDVYNCSVPFEYEGARYVFGRVENREEWATSVTVLFRLNEQGKYERVEGFAEYPLEDPFFSKIGDEYFLGGTFVEKEGEKICTYYINFYRGKSPFSLELFATGPDYMKDIRFLQLDSGKIGVFSRPRCDKIMEEYGTVSQIGYTEIDSMDELTAEVIEKARFIPDIFAKEEWGGANQAVALKDGLIGIIGHQGRTLWEGDFEYPLYVNTAYVFDPKTHRILEKKVIGLKSDYPDCETKTPHHVYCAFTSGIVQEGGKTYLYSGLGDACEGWIEIPDPFQSYR